ncbi:hypothetical protein [Steroidobacter agaridevorans]|uniref:hypothetical protein n=1 Tax=Steroidobacter agaridevorans TaxID=2695856 RepID=UPI00137A7A6C|nr:hypothetical protein [Steroidobacter agaridevorans]
MPSPSPLRQRGRLRPWWAGSAIANGTLELSYQYVNDAKATKTGTVAIPFAATTANNVIATAACEMV